MEDFETGFSVPVAAKRKPNKDRDREAEQRECSICSSVWTNAGIHQCSSLKCGHLFGMNCIRKWINSHKSCPLCRESAKESDIRLLRITNILAVDNSENARLTESLAEALKLLETANVAINDYERLEKRYKQAHNSLHAVSLALYSLEATSDLGIHFRDIMDLSELIYSVIASEAKDIVTKNKLFSTADIVPPSNPFSRIYPEYRKDVDDIFRNFQNSKRNKSNPSVETSDKDPSGAVESKEQISDKVATVSEAAGFFKVKSIFKPPKPIHKM